MSGLPDPATLGDYSVYVAWAIDPTFDPVVNLGAVENGANALPSIDLNKFTVVVSAEREGGGPDRQGRLVLRAQSPSMRMRPADVTEFALGLGSGAGSPAATEWPEPPGAGVATIRTTGSIAPYGELNMREAIRAGDVPGPRIDITAAYITGGDSGGDMALINSPEQARRLVRYWSEEGATWLKAYTNIRTEDLAAAIDEAHKVGMKVTGHICSVSFTGAAELGIDNIELGLLTNSDYSENKERDVCLPEDAAHIREVRYVFKDGVGYDSEKLLEAVKGRVGIN